MTSAAELLSRLTAVRVRLDGLAGREPPDGLTDPDQPSGERWDWGQVWAHMAEFPAYWTARVREALADSDPEPVPFGRTKADTGRIEAIERDRGLPAPDLMARLRPDLDAVAGLIAELSPEQWAREVRHSTLGVMDMRRVFDEFVVGHLEAHADQLDGLVAGAGSS